jgi:hypothetical protein
MDNSSSILASFRSIFILTSCVLSTGLYHHLSKTSLAAVILSDIFVSGSVITQTIKEDAISQLSFKYCIMSIFVQLSDHILLADQ